MIILSIVLVTASALVMATSLLQPRGMRLSTVLGGATSMLFGFMFLARELMGESHAADTVQWILLAATIILIAADLWIQWNRWRQRTEMNAG